MPFVNPCTISLLHDWDFEERWMLGLVVVNLVRTMKGRRGLGELGRRDWVVTRHLAIHSYPVPFFSFFLFLDSSLGLCIYICEIVTS